MSGPIRYPVLHDPEILREMRIDRGMAPLEMAKEIGCTSRAVFRALAEYNLETRNAPATEPADAVILETESDRRIRREASANAMELRWNREIQKRDALIRQQATAIELLQEQVDGLTSRVATLEQTTVNICAEVI